MLRFAVKRLVSMVVILLALTAVLFILQQISPTDPVLALVGHADKQVIEATRRRLGYNQPVIIQYFRYVGDVARGNLQESLRTRRPVTADLGEFLPATVSLVVFAIVLALLGGLALGVTSASRWKGATVLRVVMVSGASAPVFLLGIAVLIVFYHDLHWLPATGQTSIANAPTGPTRLLVVDAIIHGRFDVLGNALVHLLLPGLCLAVGPAVAIGRVLRSSLTGNLRMDYARTARAKGLSETRVVLVHVMRNCLNGALSMTGLQVGGMFAGVAVVEQIFAWPGIGSYIAQSILADDLPAVMGVTLVLGAIYVIANAVVDVLQAVVDPRIMLE